MFYQNKPFIKSTLYLSILLFLSINLPKSQAQSLFFDQLSIKEGLPHNTVYAMAQDHEGFVWLGTHSGLVRYDGYNCINFQRVKNKNQEEISIKTVHSLFFDSKGILWVGTEANGLIICNTNTGEWSQSLVNQYIKSEINSIFEDKKGRFWIATMNNGCFILNEKHEILQHFDTQNSALKSNSVFSFVEDKNSKIWLVAAGNGLYCFDGQLNHVTCNISDNETLSSFRKCLFYDQNETLWIGAENDGLYLYNFENQQFKHYKKDDSSKLPSNNISDIKAMPNGKIWLTSDGDGLLICEPTTMVFQQEKHLDVFYKGLNTNNLLKIFLDKDGNKWLATFNGGVNIWKKYKTYFPNLKEWTNSNLDFSAQSILGILETRKGQIWFATDGGGLNVWDKNTKNWQVFKHKIGGQSFPSGNVAKTIFEDSKGNIWVGYFNNGLDCYNPTTRQNKYFQQGENNPNTLSDNNIWSIAEDKNGNLWFGTLGGGLCKYDPKTGLFTRFLHDYQNANSVAENGIFVVFADEENKIWIGTKNSGLTVFDQTNNTFTHFSKNNTSESISGNDIRSIYKDKKGRLWIGTESAGLNQYLGNGQFKKYDTSDGLLNNSVIGIAEDNNGFLWLSSFQGICRFDVDKKQFTNYDFHVSNLHNQFNQLSVAKLSDSSLCFGGIDGINIVKANQILENTLSPTVHISDFKVFNQSIFPNDETRILTQSLAQTEQIDLAYTQNLFTFDFSALEYTSPLEIRYAYQLVGFDRDIRFTNKKEQSVSYKLDPGSYTFKVYSTNSNGVWSDKITEIKVVVHPPFWKTWWFRLLILVGFVALVRWLIKLYNERREEQWKAAIVEQEKEILRLKNLNLENEIEGKNTELMSKALKMGHKNEIMQELKEGLQELRSEQNEKGLKVLRNLEKLVNGELQNEDAWEQFNLYFDQINNNFTSTLLKQYPNLTTNDVRTCILIKLNLSIKEMATLLNISTQGVEKSKYRLKKRLNLSLEDDLTEFLRKF
jgi:ligand-binding sensor domain-containing protein